MQVTMALTRRICLGALCCAYGAQKLFHLFAQTVTWLWVGVRVRAGDAYHVHWKYSWNSDDDVLTHPRDLSPTHPLDLDGVMDDRIEKMLAYA